MRMRTKPTLATRSIRWLTIPAVFVGLLLVLDARNGDQSVAATSSAATAELPSAALQGPTGEALTAHRAEARERPGEAQALAELGDAYYQRGRELTDGRLNDLARRAYEEASALDPANVTALTGEATIALVAHDFDGGLVLARRARRVEPGLAAPFLPLIDALIETGRYEEASRRIDDLLALKPSLAAYARASYFEELHGEDAAAVRAMRFAADAGGPGTEARASALTLLGDLHFNAGRYNRASVAYREALAHSDSYVPARAGLLKVTAANGRLQAARSGYRVLVEGEERLEYADELGRVEEAMGDEPAASRHYEILTRVHEKELAAGQGADAGMVIFEADHGSPATAVRLAREVWRSAPSVTSADAYSWALHRAGQHESAAARRSADALRLGTSTPVVPLPRRHDRCSRSGDDARARRAPATSGRGSSPAFDPLFSIRASRALARKR